ncbi:MAG: hypothetical protein C0410_10605, partial [Anaerolinea sp.]|nr:hypothetical protein [Anaerolinea sp.]
MNQNQTYFVTKRPHAVKELVLFFIITYTIMFGLGGLGMVFRSNIERIFGPINNNNPYVMLLICGPTIAGLALTLIFEGWRGLVALFKRGIVKIKLKWWLIALLTVPLVFLVYGLFTLLTGIGSNSFNWKAFFGTFSLLVFSLQIFKDMGPLGEELGWRGYALPRLLQIFSPIVATLILSVFWTCFHVVSFLSAGTEQFVMSFFWFTVFVFSMCFIMTWLYMNTGGSWIVSGLLQHYIFNTFMFNDTTKVGPGLSISFVILVLVIILFKGFSKNHKEKSIEKITEF